MPLGLKNAPATFMNLMNSVFYDYIYQFIVACLGDILVFSGAFEDHVIHFQKALRKLQENQVFAKLSKCEFAQKSVLFIGHVITGDGIAMETKFKQ